MLDNKALDIVIGLVFIYTLYSLLATTIQEFVATIFAYRHRMLERGLEQMLDGKNYSYYWWDKVANMLKWLGLWVEKRGGEVPEVSSYLEKRNLETNVPPRYGRVKLDNKAALFAAQVTNHPLFRRRAENSLLYKKPAYLESTAFSDILIDLFHANKQLPLLLKDIETEIEKSPLINAELKNILLLHIRQANGDLTRFKGLVENWYDDTMDRVSGWYKRQTQRILFTIGMILAIMFNINTLEIVRILAVDEKVRAALVANAEKFVEKKLREDSLKKNQLVSMNGPAIASVPVQEKKDTGMALGKQNNPADPTQAQASGISPQDSLKISDSLFLQESKQKFERIRQFYHDEINEQNKLLGLGWGDFGFQDNYNAFLKDSAAYVKSRSNAQGQKKINKPKAPEPPGAWQKARYIVSKIPENFLGFLITALAISLGAPFWFDLLNKLVRLRSTGKKPADSRQNSSISAFDNNLPNRLRPDPTAKG
jgi:hypothetical protein